MPQQIAYLAQSSIRVDDGNFEMYGEISMATSETYKTFLSRVTEAREAVATRSGVQAPTSRTVVLKLSGQLYEVTRHCAIMGNVGFLRRIGRTIIQQVRLCR